MASLSETLPARLNRWVAQLAAGDGPNVIEGSGEDGLRAHAVVEAAIRLPETGKVIEVAAFLR